MPKKMKSSNTDKNKILEDFIKTIRINYTNEKSKHSNFFRRAH